MLEDIQREHDAHHAHIRALLEANREVRDVSEYGTGYVTPTYPHHEHIRLRSAER